ncbi:hypothetical protein AVEN_79224-1 [Araneus ventricosus]|uniref:Uncharacterized protein n=1 Tax=Araneus ventricosus TaxID=182803 RepID=A0A4Y2K939_ARAVE|nr:hypothetical protein AVEN_79224-1 [Araneus ventricosus]
MRAQIVAILLVAVVCCKANYLPGTFGLGGASYAGATYAVPSYAGATYAVPSYAGATYAGALGLGYPASPVAPSNAYAAAYNPAAAVKVTYVAPSDLGNYVVVSDVAAPVPAPAPAVSYTVVDSAPVIKDAASRYVAPLRSYGNIAYVVKK